MADTSTKRTSHFFDLHLLPTIYGLILMKTLGVLIGVIIGITLLGGHPDSIELASDASQVIVLAITYKVFHDIARKKLSRKLI